MNDLINTQNKQALFYIYVTVMYKKMENQIKFRKK